MVMEMVVVMIMKKNMMMMTTMMVEIKEYKKEKIPDTIPKIYLLT